MEIIQNVIISLYHQLLYRSIVIAILGCFILLLRKLINRKLQPRCNYIIWVVFVVICVFPIYVPSQFSIYRFIDMGIFEKSSSQYANDILNLAENVNDSDIYDNMKGEILDNHQKNRKYLACVIVDVCLIVTIAKLGILVGSYMMLNRRIGERTIEDERIATIVDECKKSLKIKRNIRILKQEEAKTPCIIGIFNVRILLTDTTILLGESELKSVIMHELSHYRRKDIWMNWLITLIQALYWFHPMMRRLVTYMKMDMEAATDSLALSKINNVKDKEYCDAIIHVAKLCSTKKEYVLGFASAKDKLLDRIVTIKKKEDFEKHTVLMLIGTLIILFIMLFVLSPTSYGNSEEVKLFLESNDGRKISVLEENIQLTEDSSLKLMAEGGKCKKIVFYDEYNLNTEKHYFGAIQLGDEMDFETGEYIYGFVLESNAGRSIKYRTKIFVE